MATTKSNGGQNFKWECTSYSPLCASMNITFRMKLLHTNKIFELYMTRNVWLTVKCITMLSVTNSSLLQMMERVLCDWKQSCKKHLIS